MSTFYGMVEGNRSCATRGGSRQSGFRASCQSWNGSVITTMHYNDEDKLIVRVGTNDGSSCSSDWNSQDFVGTFDEFKDFLKLYRDIKNGKVSVLRHRDPDGSKKLKKQMEYLGIEGK